MAPEDQDPYQAELVATDQAGQNPVIDATPAPDEGTDSVDAQWAAWHQSEAAELHQEQLDATAAGDYDKAGDFARAEGYELQDAQGLGATVDPELAQAQSDQTNLGDAAWDQHSADYFAQSAADAPSEASAEGYAAVADSYAGHADDAAAATGAEAAPEPSPDPTPEPAADPGTGSE